MDEYGRCEYENALITDFTEYIPELRPMGPATRLEEPVARFLNVTDAIAVDMLGQSEVPYDNLDIGYVFDYLLFLEGHGKVKVTAESLIRSWVQINYIPNNQFHLHRACWKSHKSGGPLTPEDVTYLTANDMPDILPNWHTNLSLLWIWEHQEIDTDKVFVAQRTIPDPRRKYEALRARCQKFDIKIRGIWPPGYKRGSKPIPKPQPSIPATFEIDRTPEGPFELSADAPRQRVVDPVPQQQIDQFVALLPVSPILEEQVKLESPLPATPAPWYINLYNKAKTFFTDLWSIVATVTEHGAA